MPLPAVNPYSTDEVEYRESGYDYAPKYPGSYDYNESGIVYREAGFPYVKRDAIVSVSTVACSADLSPVFTYVYTPKRPGGVAYASRTDYNTAGYDYNERDTSIPDNRPLVDYTTAGVSYSQSADIGHTVEVIATPSAIAVTTEFSATPSVPATVQPDTVACPVVVVAEVTAQTIVVDAGIAATAALPSPAISISAVPETIAAAAAMPEISLYITVDATPGTIAATSTVHDGTYVVDPRPATIASTGVVDAVVMKQLLEIPTTEIVPSVGLPNKPTHAAYALMRHYGPGLRGDNIFIINGTTVQDFRPADQATITRWIYGGHDSPDDLTTSEQLVLVAAGYGFRVGPE